VTVSSS
jgi:hypothetical protein